MTAPTRDVSPAPADPGNAAPTTQAQRFVERLAATVNLKPGGRLNPVDERIVTEELEHAIRAIARRRAREQQASVFAMGPPGGEYARVIEAIVAGIAKASRQVRLRTLETEGSVENAVLLGRGDVQYGLIQSDVAALAAAGEGPFVHGGPIANLAALGSLYPEPVHVVVPAKSSIRTVNDLRGKRVDLGAAGSGTRLNALAVLQAYGIALKDLGEARDQGPQAAMQRLQSGQIDAFFTTIGAPGRALQRLATAYPVRMLSLSASTIERLVTEHPSLVRLTVPANTYPGQTEPITTVAPTALLVGTTDAPREDVEALLKLVFEQTDFLAAGSALGAKISRQTGLRGVAMPLHPAATSYFGSAATGGAKSPEPAAPSDALTKKSPPVEAPAKK
jgi:TRAP transporter TAXI family solute receptor